MVQILSVLRLPSTSRRDTTLIEKLGKEKSFRIVDGIERHRPLDRDVVSDQPEIVELDASAVTAATSEFESRRCGPAGFLQASSLKMRSALLRSARAWTTCSLGQAPARS